MFYLEHRVEIPFCYYNRYTDKVDIKINVTGAVKNIKMYYNDPYDYITKGEESVWNPFEIEMGKLFSTSSSETWAVSIDVPKWKRLKYAFIITDFNDELYYYSENIFEKVKDENEYILGHHNHFSFPFIHEVDAPKVPKWAEDIIWYQIFPERFCNGNKDINPEKCRDWNDDENYNHNDFFGGDIYGIIEKLDYLQNLGITGLYLTPVFKSPSSHKYDTTDYLEIDEHFGDKEVFKKLVVEAHKRDMKIMIDAVFNHIGENHKFWQDVLKNQENSIYKDYFHIRKFPVDEKKEEKDLNYETFAHCTNMPKWNTENPQVRKYLLDVAKYWISEFDIDGWRLDVANEISFDFWKDFSKEVRSVKEDIYILGEIWFNSAKWINPGYFDAVMNYTIGFPIKEMFLEHKITAKSMTEKLFSSMMKYSDIHNKVGFNLIDSHDTLRVLNIANGNKQSVKNAFTFLFLLKGSPMIYYGTEVGVFGVEDPFGREPMIWNEDVIDYDLLNFYRKLIKFRKNLKNFLKECTMEYVSEKNYELWKFKANGHKDLLVYYNKSKNNISIDEHLNIVFTSGNSTSKEVIVPNTITIYQ